MGNCGQVWAKCGGGEINSGDLRVVDSWDQQAVMPGGPVIQRVWGAVPPVAAACRHPLGPAWPVPNYVSYVTAAAARYVGTNYMVPTKPKRL